MSVSHLINANIHRVKEGARVLEDVARFVLKNENLFQRVRQLRHSLISAPVILDKQEDPGAAQDENNVRQSLLAMVQANIIRMQEGLRVLEETCDHIDAKQGFKALRYHAYALQQDFLRAIKLCNQQTSLHGLYLIVDPTIIALSLQQIAQVINTTTVTVVQYRNKRATKKDFLHEVMQLRDLLHSNKLLIVNDHLDIALDIADGVHLGQDDYPIERVRKLIPETFILGVTCHNVCEAQIASRAGASYVSLGCVYRSTSKKDTTPISLHEIAKIKAQLQIPICVIGGIGLQNIDQLLALKIDMVAALSSIWATPDPLNAIKALQKKLSVVFKPERCDACVWPASAFN